MRHEVNENNQHIHNYIKYSFILALQGVFKARRASLRSDALKLTKLKDMRAVVIVQKVCRGWLLRFHQKREILLKKIAITRIRQKYRRRMQAALIITSFIRHVSELTQKKNESKVDYQSKRVQPIIEKTQRLAYELDATYTRLKQDTFFDKMYLNKLPKMKQKKWRPIKSQAVSIEDNEGRRFKSILSDPDGSMSPTIEKLKSQTTLPDQSTITLPSESPVTMVPSVSSGFELPRDSLHRSRLMPVKHNKFSVPQNRSFLVEKASISNSGYIHAIKSKIYLSPIHSTAAKSIPKKHSSSQSVDSSIDSNNCNDRALSPTLLSRLRDVIQ